MNCSKNFRLNNRSAFRFYSVFLISIFPDWLLSEFGKSYYGICSQTVYDHDNVQCTEKDRTKSEVYLWSTEQYHQKKKPWPKTVFSLHLRSERVLTFKQESYWVKAIRVRYKILQEIYNFHQADLLQIEPTVIDIYWDKTE